MTIMKMIMLSQVGLVLDSLDDIHCLTEAKQKEEVGRIERTNYRDDGDDSDGGHFCQCHLLKYS